MMSKIQLWSQGRLKNNTRKGKTCDILLSIQSENGDGTKILGQRDISKEIKKKQNKRGAAVPDLQQIMHQLEA